MFAIRIVFATLYSRYVSYSSLGVFVSSPNVHVCVYVGSCVHACVCSLIESGVFVNFICYKHSEVVRPVILTVVTKTICLEDQG